MTTKQKPLKWDLPEVLHPIDSVCFQIEIPNDRAYIGAFFGAMYLLSKPYAWADDPDHTALEVGKIFKEIFYGIKRNNCKDCPPLPGITIEDVDMGLRVDCDCNVFVTCCDGTEKQILTAEQVRSFLGQQPGSGSPQPQPGGGCQQYDASVNGNGLWLLPTVVNTGDTIEVTGATGVFYDGANGLWHCPPGDIFFAGLCTGTFQSDSSAPIPGSPDGKLIAKIGPTFYDVIDSVFTVPAGVSSAEVVFLQNTSDRGASGGNVSFSVLVCNNQDANYHHDFNFEINTAGFAPEPQNEAAGCTAAGANWAGGIGWYQYSCPLAGYINIGRDTPLTNITHIEFAGEVTVSTLVASDFELYLTYGGTEHLVGTSSITALGPIGISLDGPWTGVTHIRVRVGVQDGSSEFTVTSVSVDGTGTDPF